MKPPFSIHGLVPSFYHDNVSISPGIVYFDDGKIFTLSRHMPFLIRDRNFDIVVFRNNRNQKIDVIEKLFSFDVLPYYAEENNFIIVLCHVHIGMKIGRKDEK